MIRVLHGDELPPNYINFTSQLFQKLTKHKHCLDVVNNALFRKFHNHLGNGSQKQHLSPEATMANIMAYWTDSYEGTPWFHENVARTPSTVLLTELGKTSSTLCWHLRKLHQSEILRQTQTETACTTNLLSLWRPNQHYGNQPSRTVT